ncbi:MAG: preprotein translocase subunit SecG [Sulfurimicrobium sp.]|jgi:preprotein translocase subunit SecG|nr:preprotein translocase subunit SecG [Sulfurimicrobium sp.]MDO9189458.1 preprotein translocase subunit SecG [Sulfurimicrobium sp.]MDP1704166.1 preprotein translocase subunit SecG [Sulfurimicrobium sp.]MDP2197728.1 preprotein translocase subunit SecG [Sulfurimicrobium sp.]MDP2962390.1 preprotein translocase subunit SecG [Sulfurimicrobium sp.]
METVVWIVHVVVALGVVGLVLMQHGKGADMGAAFGSGASGSLFGSTGSANFLSRATAVLATVFFVTSMTLTYFSGIKGKPMGVMESQKHVLPVTQPVAPAGPASKAKDIPN